jgi:hypothetical protein
MKKYLLLIALFLIFILSSAFQIIGTGGVVAGGAPTEQCASCGTCTGCATADLGCIDWTTGNCSAALTVDDAVGTVNQDADPDSNWGSWNIGADVLEIGPITDAGDALIAFDLPGGIQNVVYTDVYILITTEELEDGDDEDIWSMGIGETTPAIKIVLQQVATDQLQLLIQYRSNSAYEDGTPYNISINTPYRIPIFYDYTGQDIEVEINDTSVLSVTDGTLDRQVSDVFLGSSGWYGSADTVTIQYGPTRTDDDTMPTDLRP